MPTSTRPNESSRRVPRHALSALFVAAFLASCSVGPNFARPAVKTSDHWLDEKDGFLDATRSEHREWWSSLDDPVLTKLVELAYAQNLTLAAAGVRVLEARAELGIAIGEIYPQQQKVSAATSYDRIPLSVPYNLVDNTYWQATLGAQAAWELDVWGKIRRGIESADDAFLASVADYDDVLVTLTGDVASTYVKIRTTERQLEIARENLERQKQALAIAQARFKGGVVTKRDVYQAENVLGQTEAAIPELTIELRRSKYALAMLLGMPPGPLNELLAGRSEIPTAPSTITVGIPADLLRRRPDVRKAELRAAAQCAQIGFAKADLLPALTLVGNVGTLTTDIGHESLGKLFTTRTLAYSAGPAVQWNVLNYGQITNNVRVQDAKFQGLLLGYQTSVLEAQREVEDGITGFIESRRQAEFLKSSVVAAEGALEIALIEYKEGAADFTTVLNAEQNLYQAENDLAVAQGNIPLGLIQVYRALGGGWQVREGKDFVPEPIRAEMAARTDWGTLLTPDLLRPQAPGLPSPEDRPPPFRLPEW